MNLPIDVIEIRPITNRGNLRAYADVRIGDITLRDCRVVQQPGQRAYVQGPHAQAVGRWWPMVALTSALRLRVQEKVLAQWNNDEVDHA